jgi:hypothetical protein
MAADEEQQQQQWDGYDAECWLPPTLVAVLKWTRMRWAMVRRRTTAGGGDWDAPPAPASEFEDPAALDAMFGDIEQQVNDFAY